MKHQRNATCAGCHQKMDGYGFALESFDVVGEWRDKYRAVGAGGFKLVNGIGIYYHFGLPVDCTGQLPDGRPFDDVNGLRKLLAADPERLARAFTSQLITYATGAEIGFADRAAVERIVKNSAASKHGLRTLLVEVVQSELFNHK